MVEPLLGETRNYGGAVMTVCMCDAVNVDDCLRVDCAWTKVTSLYEFLQSGVRLVILRCGETFYFGTSVFIVLYVGGVKEENVLFLSLMGNE